MNFYEWSQTHLRQDDLIGDIARDMKDDVFRRLRIKKYSVDQWRSRIRDLSNNDEDVMFAFKLAVKEYKNGL